MGGCEGVCEGVGNGCEVEGGVGVRLKDKCEVEGGCEGVGDGCEVEGRVV